MPRYAARERISCSRRPPAWSRTRWLAWRGKPPKCVPVRTLHTIRMVFSGRKSSGNAYQYVLQAKMRRPGFRRQRDTSPRKRRTGSRQNRHFGGSAGVRSPQTPECLEVSPTGPSFPTQSMPVHSPDRLDRILRNIPHLSFRATCARSVPCAAPGRSRIVGAGMRRLRDGAIIATTPRYLLSPSSRRGRIRRPLRSAPVAARRLGILAMPRMPHGNGAGCRALNPKPLDMART